VAQAAAAGSLAQPQHIQLQVVQVAPVRPTRRRASVALEMEMTLVSAKVVLESDTLTDMAAMEKRGKKCVYAFFIVLYCYATWHENFLHD